MFVSKDARERGSTWTDNVLAKILDPLPTSTFIDEYWSRRPLHQTGHPERFSHLLTSGDIEFLVTSLVTPQPSWISLVRDGADLPISKLTSNGHITANGFRQAWANGFTVQLPSLHRRWPALGGFCRSLEGELMTLGVALSRPILANAYATPPAVRGLRPHYDDHEVLVLQLEGHKRWRIFQPTTPSPLTPLTGSIPEERLGPPESEILMAPGDILYIPRGHPHDASPVGGSTLHVTLAISCNTWLDLAVSLLSQDPLFRANLPPVPGGSLRQGRAWSGELRDLYQKVRQGPEETATVISQLRENLMRSIQPALQAFVEYPSSPVEITLETVVATRPGSFVQFDKRSDGVALLFPGGVHHGMPGLEATFQFIAGNPSFAVRALPSSSDPDKLRLVTDLVTKGCLVVL